MQKETGWENKISPLAYSKGGFGNCCCYWCKKYLFRAAYHFGGNKNPKSKTLRTHRSGACGKPARTCIRDNQGER